MVRFTCVGGIDARVLPGRAVYLPRTHCYGVIGVKPIHLIDSAQRGKTISVDDLALDLGVDSKEETLKLVNPETKSDLTSKAGPTREISGAAKRWTTGPVAPFYCSSWKKSTIPTSPSAFWCRKRWAAGAPKPWRNGCSRTTPLCWKPPPPPICRGYRSRNRSASWAKGQWLDLWTEHRLQPNPLPNGFPSGRGAKHPHPAQNHGGRGQRRGAIHTAAGGVKTLAISVPCRYLHSPSCVIDPQDAYAVRDLANVLAQEILAGRVQEVIVCTNSLNKKPTTKED